MHYGNVLEYIEIHKPELDQKIAFVSLPMASVLDYSSHSALLQVKGITAGLACLHNHNPPVCHADLKPVSVVWLVQQAESED